MIYWYAIEQETGALSGRRVFVRVGTDEGLPDRLTVDDEGFVWSAQWYGGCVVRYDPDGTPERQIPLPVTQTSSFAFGGSDLNDLYVTSAAEPWRSAFAPRGYDWGAPNVGGSVYRLRLDVRGRLENRTSLDAPGRR